MRLHSVSSIRVTRQYPKGTVVEARVQLLKPFEAVVALKDGTKGIIRNRELSWGPEPQHSEELLAEGQIVRVLVIGMDRDQPRLNLSLRLAERDPWKEIDRRYKVGQVVVCNVVRLRRGGAFVELEPAVDGFLPLHEVCADSPHRIEEVLWVGDNVEAVIVQLDPRDRQIELSIKRHLANLKRQRDVLFGRKYIAPENEGGSSLGDFLSDQERIALITLLKDIADTSSNGKDRIGREPARVERLRKILIADDDRSFRTSLQRLLTRLGHEVDVADSAEKAVTLCTSENYDLLLIDLGFAPGNMDGLQASRTIRSIKPNLPIVMVTAGSILNRYENIINEAQTIGARSVLLKPVDLNSLCHVMAGIVDGTRDWDERICGGTGTNLENFQLPSGLAPPPEGLVKTIREELGELGHSTEASACVLFRMDPATREVQVFVNTGTPLIGYDSSKYTLQATPIDEVIRLGRQVLETDTSLNPHRFQYLDLFDYGSCVGVPVKSFGTTEYGLFLFHPKKGHFKSGHLKQANVTAKVTGAILARDEAERIIQRVQPFVFSGQIGSTTVHELNNRVGSILNDAETLMVDQQIIEGDLTKAIDLSLRDEMGVCIRSLERSSKAMRRIASLHLGMVSTGARELVNVNEVVLRAAEILAPLAEAQRVRILTEMENDLPPTLAISVQLEQAFVNIALNAIQHIGVGQGAEGVLIIHSRFEKQNLQRPIQVRFTDTGPGIHGNHLERVFDLGFSTRSGGTGLGLFTTRWLIESMSGQVSVDKSAMLVGTTFLIELPLIVPSLD